MSINHLTTGQDWVEAMINHQCMSGRAYLVSDDSPNRAFGYECSVCSEVFRITKAHLRNSGPKGLISALRDRDAFAKRVAKISPGTGGTSLSTTSKSVGNMAQAMNNRQKLTNEGISITLR